MVGEPRHIQTDRRCFRERGNGFAVQVHLLRHAHRVFDGQSGKLVPEGHPSSV
jgi:hypothetical protein